jgi:hypothetical protein
MEKKELLGFVLNKGCKRFEFCRLVQINDTDYEHKT